MISFVKQIALAAHLATNPAGGAAQDANTDFISANHSVYSVNDEVTEATLSEQIQNGLAEKTSFGFTISYNDANGTRWNSSTVVYAREDDIFSTSQGTIDQIVPYGVTEDTEFTIKLEPFTSIDTINQRYGFGDEAEETNTFTFRELRELLLEQGYTEEDLTDVNLMAGILIYMTDEIIEDLAEKIENESDPAFREVILRYFDVDANVQSPEEGSTGPSRSI